MQPHRPPCKTSRRDTKTARRWISALDPGGFGAVTITKSITINGDGTLAGILAAGANGIIINALGTDKIIIRGISINGANTGLNGIRVLSAGQVTIENTTIYGFQSSVSSRCIDVVTPNGAELVVINSTMTNCANGIRLQNTANLLLVTIDRTAITNMNSIGIEAAVGDARVNIKGSNISSNGTDGLKVSSSLGLFNVEDSLLGFNVGIAINASERSGRWQISGNTIVNDRPCHHRRRGTCSRPVTTDRRQRGQHRRPTWYTYSSSWFDVAFQKRSTVSGAASVGALASTSVEVGRSTGAPRGVLDGGARTRIGRFPTLVAITTSWCIRAYRLPLAMSTASARRPPAWRA